MMMEVRKHFVIKIAIFQIEQQFERHHYTWTDSDDHWSLTKESLTVRKIAKYNLDLSFLQDTAVISIQNHGFETFCYCQ